MADNDRRPITTPAGTRFDRGWRRFGDFLTANVVRAFNPFAESVIVAVPDPINPNFYHPWPVMIVVP